MRELKRFDEQFLLRELSRLSALANFPSEHLVGWTPEKVDAVVDDMLLMLDEACVSEEHVIQTMAEWKYANDFFPTEHQLRQQAWSIRPRYEPSFSTEEPKYPPAGPPVEMPPELADLWAKACANVDSQTQMWAAIKRELRVTDFAKVSWLRIAETKRKLGYPLNEGDRRAIAPTRERPASWSQPPNGEPMPPQPQNVITAADFDQARRDYEQKKSGDK